MYLFQKRDNGRLLNPDFEVKSIAKRWVGVNYVKYSWQNNVL
jgi:hypothetical protein